MEYEVGEGGMESKTPRTGKEQGKRPPPTSPCAIWRTLRYRTSWRPVARSELYEEEEGVTLKLLTGPLQKKNPNMPL
eukprot:755733-Hanusia_phi.AAC.1